MWGGDPNRPRKKEVGMSRLEVGDHSDAVRKEHAEFIQSVICTPIWSAKFQIWTKR